MTPLGNIEHHDHAVRDSNARWALGEQRARIAEVDARPRRWALSSDYDGNTHLVVLIEGRSCWYWTGEHLDSNRALAHRFESVAAASVALRVLRAQDGGA